MLMGSRYSRGKSNKPRDLGEILRHRIAGHLESRGVEPGMGDGGLFRAIGRSENTTLLTPRRYRARRHGLRQGAASNGTSRAARITAQPMSPASCARAGAAPALACATRGSDGRHESATRRARRENAMRIRASRAACGPMSVLFREDSTMTSWPYFFYSNSM
jgi:hypothetical protein